MRERHGELSQYRGSIPRAPVLQGGAILLLALIFSLMLSLAAAAVIEMGALQSYMARNSYFQEEALQNAVSIGRAVSRERSNFNPDSRVGQSNCPPGANQPGCELEQLVVPAPAALSAGTRIDYRVVRMAPLELANFPLRETESHATTVRFARAALFEVQVMIDGSAAALGSAGIAQGVALRLPAARWD